MMKKMFLFLLLQSILLMGNAQLYHVGDLYIAEDGSQGIVFFVQEDGSGWAVALNDLSTSIPWSPNSFNVPGLSDEEDLFAPISSTNDFSGYTNTQQIRNTFGVSSSYAAGAVDFNHGWYLPSIHQLYVLYAQLPFIEQALLNAGGSTLVFSASGYSQGYWSSSEASTSQAWALYFGFQLGSGVPMQMSKTTYQNQKVRAVHDFPSPNNVYDTTLTYSWNTGSTEPHFFDVPLQTTNYTVTVTNAYGCTNTDSVNVMVIDNNPQTIYDTVCQGSAYNNNGFTVSAQETTEAGEIVRTHTLVAADCESEVTLILTVVPHDTVQIEQTASESFVWNGVTYNESGTYTQHFNNHNGCDSMVVLTLTIDGGVDPGPGPDPGPEPDTIPFGENDSLFLYLPNAITSSRMDGINDYFYLPEAYHPFINEFEISIFNRWGVQVFHATDKHFRWDGTINGRIYYSAVYNYIIRFYDIIGRPYYLKGSFTVL